MAAMGNAFDWSSLDRVLSFQERLKSSSASSASPASAPSTSTNLDDIKQTWNTAFDQRQKEAESNAQRAFKYRNDESLRDFGQKKDFSAQEFSQDRAIKNDELTSLSNREAAQAQAKERLQRNEFDQQRSMADFNQRLQQRQQESERGAAMNAFRGRR